MRVSAMQMLRSQVDLPSGFPYVYASYILILLNEGTCFSAHRNLKLGNVSLSKPKRAQATSVDFTESDRGNCVYGF